MRRYVIIHAPQNECAQSDLRTTDCGAVLIDKRWIGSVFVDAIGCSVEKLLPAASFR